MFGVALLSLLATTPDAAACGGFFCNQSQPVLQNAERVIFGIDEEEGVVDTHVQIFYEGPAEEFAWIVPVPAEPELWVSSDQLFSIVATQTAPTFDLRTVEEGNCRTSGSRNTDLAMAQPAESSATADDGGIDIVNIQQVGAYDTVTLRAESSADLLAFLQDHNYDLPDDLEPLLAPYVAEDAYFVALRLSKDKDTGDITPLGMRYAGTQGMIPVQLTSVAATPDMRVEAYVFSGKRAVPSSYLHVQINELAVDWWSFGANYNDVISRAADEAGGNAFATDFAGDPAFMADQLYRDGQYDLDSLRGSADAVEWIYAIQGQGFAPTQLLLDTILDHVQAPSDADPQDFVNCPDCYSGWDPSDFDAVTATDALEQNIVEPLRAAEGLFEHAVLSRMTSSLDAIEMTVDPVFVLNADMSTRVERQHSADFIYECGNGKKREKALRRLELEDGRSVLLPSEQWLEENGMTPFEYLADLGATKAHIIEETGAEGEPTVLFDLTDDLDALTDAHNQNVLRLVGCGCAVTGGNALGSVGLLGLLALGTVRRRRR